MNHDSLFEEPRTGREKDHSSLIMVVSGIAVLVVVGLVVLVASRPSSQKPDEGWVKAGTAEFNAYAPFIKISSVDKTTSSTLIGSRLGYLKGIVQNTGNKTLIGLRVRGLAVGFGNETLAQRTATPIPRVRDSLDPNQSMEVRVQIDPIPDPNTIMDMQLRLDEFKLK